jgi:ATP-dependent DNA helicase RecQ
VLALTATATDEVIDDIGRQLNRPRMNVINTGIYRPNLHYRVVQVTNPDEKLEEARRLVRETEGKGIVYAATVKAAEEMHQLLEEQGESVTLYHGKLPAAERKANQDLFMNDERRVMVATNAFGMGIDKPDTRFVIHLQIPGQPGSLLPGIRPRRPRRQGRRMHAAVPAGRQAGAAVLPGEALPDADEIRAVYEAVRELAENEAATPSASRTWPGDLAGGHLKVCLKLLKDAKLLRQNRKLAYNLTAQAPKASLFEAMAEVYRRKQEHDKEALEQMVGYAVSGFCRWKLLLDYFGDEVEGFEKCCRCDNCLNPPAAVLPTISRSATTSSTASPSPKPIRRPRSSRAPA